jgi:hypothetical protein
MLIGSFQESRRQRCGSGRMIGYLVELSLELKHLSQEIERQGP